MIRTNWERFSDAKSRVSFPLAHKHVVNEHRVIRKSHDATQEKCPYVVHFNAPCDWFETTSQHRYCEGGKNIFGSRSLLGREVTNRWYHSIFFSKEVPWLAVLGVN